MEIPVLIEPLATNGYRARGGEPFGLSAEGATQEEALAKLKEQLQERLRNGVAIVPLEVSAEVHPLAEFAGMYSADDPMVKEWKKAMAEYRRRIDEHPELP